MPAAPSWLEGRDESWGRRLLLLPLQPLGWLWSVGARFQRWLYEAGIRPRRRLPCAVISVGSLLAGGVGKTPTAAWLAAALDRRGHRTVLASRGYRRRGRAGPVVVADERGIRSRAELAGDEPMLLAAKAPGVPVLVDRNRVRLGWRAIGAYGARVLVLDDGFQHHALYRDLDVVLLDAGLGFGNRRCLPRGPLREPLAALSRADVVGVIDPPLTEAEAVLVDQLAPEALRFEARRRPLGLRPLGGGDSEAPESLRGAPVGMLCGLGRPASLRRSLEGLGARIVAARCFRDHHVYRARDLVGLDRQAPVWVTTEKDAVKLRSYWAGAAELRVLSMGLEVDAPERLLRELEARIA